MEVKEESINQVREISRFRRTVPKSATPAALKSYMAERAVLSWLITLYPDSEISVTGHFRRIIVTRKDGTTMGFEVKYVRNLRLAIGRGRDALDRAHYEVVRGNLNSVTMVFVTDDEPSVVDAESWLESLSLPDSVHTIVGVVEPKGASGRRTFRPIAER